jgi:hypothetical protein
LLKAAWTFTRSGHGKSPCDGFGAVVKSAAHKYLLKQGPEAAFCTAKDFYQITLEKINRTFYSTEPVRPNQKFNTTFISNNNDSTGEEVNTIAKRSTRPIEVKWLHEKDVEETFQKVLKTRWSKLSSKSNVFISLKSVIFLFNVDRIVDIRSFHEFESMFTDTVICRSVSNSITSKSFQLSRIRIYVHSLHVY